MATLSRHDLPLMSSTSSSRKAQAPTPAWLGAAPGLFVFLWSTGFIGARMSAPDAEPLTFLAVRFALAASILAVAALVLGAPWPRGKAAAHALVAGSLLHGAYLGAVFWAISHGLPAGVAALIAGLQPLLTTVIAASWLGEAVTIRHWLGLGVGLLGVALVLWPKFDFAGAGITPVTAGVAFLGMVSITVGSIYQKRFVAGQDLRSGNALQFVGATVVTFALAALFETFTIRWTGPVVFAMAWLVLVLSIGAITIFYLMIRHGDVSRVAALFYLVPAVTAAIAWAMFGEMLNLMQIAGMAVCAAAVLMVTRRRSGPA
ncbi:MAG: DMT family transporter [Parvibaculaceae bacterium]